MALSLVPVHDPDSQFNFDRIALAMPDTGTESLIFRVGVAAFVFGGVTSVTNSTIAHGLGRTPAGWVALPNSNNITLDYVAATGDATNLTIRATSTVGALTNTFHAFWLAWG